MQQGIALVEGADVASAAAGLRTLAAPGERRCDLPTREALEVLADSLAGARLSPVGWVAAVNELASAVSVQRKVEAELALVALPDRLHRPVVVGGLPRCGTALLHQLLGLSDSLRSARRWEVASPTAPSEARRTDDDQVVRDAVRLSRLRLELLEVVAPQLPELPPISAHSRDGCTQLLHQSLCSLQMLISFRASGYATWLIEQDLRPVYQFWAAQLRLLDHGPDVRWLGASSFHTFGYDALWSVAPDATVVHMRRSPVTAFEAFLDVVVSVRHGFSDAVDARDLAGGWLELWATMLRRATEAAARDGREIVVVDHDDLRDDPVGVVSALCVRLGVEAPEPRTVGAMAAVLREREREREQLNGWERFGFSRAQVEAALMPLQEELDRGTDHLR